MSSHCLDVRATSHKGTGNVINAFRHVDTLQILTVTERVALNIRNLIGQHDIGQTSMVEGIAPYLGQRRLIEIDTLQLRTVIKCLISNLGRALSQLHPLK